MNNYKTYREVGIESGLEGMTLNRFVAYMSERWSSDEVIKCLTGYAHEWAERFKECREHEASDFEGRVVLHAIDEMIRLGRGGEKYGL